MTNKNSWFYEKQISIYWKTENEIVVGWIFLWLYWYIIGNWFISSSFTKPTFSH